tara:strand:- start:1638 stop:2750 length:1113 start_codon:yes stop_codon:yes gene_type:complete
MQPLVKSEIDSLSLVIVQKPGLFHDQMHPDHIKEYLANGNPNPEYLLFDDLIDTNLAIKEHDEFTNIIKKITGNEGCLYFDDLMSGLESNFQENIPIPLPNLIFTRDLAVTIGQKIVSTWASKNVRNYENQITKNLLNHHEFFKDTEIIHFSEIAPGISLEGGDVTVFNEDLVIIGLGERTSEESIKKLEPIIFSEGFNRIYAVELPKKRSMMHIDTVFTRISEEDVLYFPPLFDNQNPNIYNISANQSISNVEPTQTNLIELLNLDGYKTNGIKCGGNTELNQYREQWTDGANAFALKPGVAIGYNRNIHTIEELKKNNYKIIPASEFISNFDKVNEEKIFITLESSELCRGRGGPRCMTLPIKRCYNG